MVAPAGGVLLCLWLFLCAQAEPADVSLPPEDMDSSGDDDDTFSGSGAGSLPDHPVVAWNVPLQEVTNASAIWELSTALGDNQPKVQETEEPRDDYTTVPVFTTIPPVFYTINPVPGRSGGAVEDDVLDSLSEQGTTRSTVVTTGFPATHHHVSTVRIATTSQASSTLKVAGPEVYHNTHHILTNERKIPASEAVPTTERSPTVTSSTTVSSIVQTDISFLPEGEVIQTEEGSADQGDFVFLPHDENQSVAVESEPDQTAVDIGPKDEKSAGAPQGIMDRKEVLGGVIAGGLVGLLFAGFLVGFMLYRMKKKDEGSYSLDEPKQSNGGYQKPHKQEEFYA